jgi:hypothetical protein
LKASGVIVNREVEIRPGQLTDIYVTAVSRDPSDEGDSIRVVIEVKGAWNRTLSSVMEIQLKNRYLCKYNTHHGLYLDVWFPRSHRQSPQQVLETGISKLKTTLTKQASEISDEAATLKAFVLDASLPSRRQKRSTGKCGNAYLQSNRATS